MTSKHFIIIVACASTMLLSAQAQDPNLMLSIGHLSNRTNSAVFSSDGKLVLSSAIDNTLRLWSADMGFLLNQRQISLTGDNNPGNVLEDAVFSADNTKILTTFTNRTTQVWSADNLEMLAELKSDKIGLDNSFSSSIQMLQPVFSPDSKMILTASANHTLQLWSASNGQLLAELTGHTDTVNLASFSPDNTKLVTASLDGEIKMWSLTSRKELFSIKNERRIWNLAFNASGKTVLINDIFKTKVIFANNGYTIFTLATSSTTRAMFSADGKKIVTVSGFNSIQVWSAASGLLLKEWQSFLDYVWKIDINPTGTILAALSSSNDIEMFSLETGQTLLDKEKWKWKDFNSISFSADGKKIIVSNFDHPFIFSGENGVLLHELKGDSRGIWSASLSPDGKTIAIRSFDRRSLTLWSAETGRLLYRLENNSFPGEPVFSGNAQKIISVSDSIEYIFPKNETKSLITITRARLKVWSVANGQKKAEILCDTSVDKIIVSNNGQIMVTISAHHIIQVWMAETGKLLRQLRYDGADPIISPDGKMIITGNYSYGYSVWSVETGKVLLRFQGLDPVFSPNGQWILYQALKSGQTIAVKPADKKLAKELEGTVPVFSADSSLVATRTTQSIKIWSAQTMELITGLKDSLCNRIAFSDDSKKLVVECNNTIKLWAIPENEVIVNFKLPEDSMTVNYLAINKENEIITIRGDKGSWFNPSRCMVWSATGKLLNNISFSDSGLYCGFNNRHLVVNNSSQVFLFNLKDKNNRARIVPIGETDFFVQASSGYYFSSPGAAKVLYYLTKEKQVVGYEQLDVKYNRPDLVMQSLGCPDAGLIQAYRFAYQKRIKKLNIDTASFQSGYNPPQADFVNRDSIQFEQVNNLLKLHIRASDNSYSLDRVNVWVNEVPVFNMKGISIRWRNARIFDTVILITLGNDLNRIETSVLNTNGIESFRIPLHVNFKQSELVAPKLVFIGIGINHYADARYDLNWSVKDIRDLAENLKKKYKNNIIIDTLFDEKVSRENVLALKQTLRSLSENDMVIMAYAGHGLFNSEADYFLSTYLINFRNPDEQGLPYGDLENLLDGIRPRQKLMLIDACNSGETDKEYLMAVRRKGNAAPAKDGEILNQKKSFELMQELFANVGRSTGATVLTAAAGTQSALETDELKNGVFTYCILEAMRQHKTLKVSALKQIVRQRVFEITKGAQQPGFRNEPGLSDWNVW